jgi:hypothetical protein
MVQFKKRYLFRGFVNEMISTKKVGKFAISTFHEKLDNAKKVGILRQLACDEKVKKTWEFFSKKICFLTLWQNIS